MATLKFGSRAYSDPADFPDQAFLGPATKVVKLTKGSPIPDGCCRFLMVGTAGTATFKDFYGNLCTDYPLVAGINPIMVTELQAGGTADDIWAHY